MTKEELKQRTKLFSIRTFKLIDTFKRSKSSEVIANQLLRSSSSVAANYRAVCRGKSRADFINKLKIVNEEADESLFWLELISELDIACNKSELINLSKEANELVSIFAASLKTLSETKS